MKTGPITEHRMTNQAQDPTQFFMTAPSPCGYIPGQMERKVFTHLIGRRAKSLNNLLSEAGFRRSQTIAYRPACERCSACVSVRVPVEEFEPSRNLVRVLERNVDLVGTEVPNTASAEHYGLFRSYLSARHTEGGMIDMNILDFTLMIEDTHVDTELVEYRQRSAEPGFFGQPAGPLLATGLTDVLSDGLSMVYSFYDPQESARSLGTYMILDHIERTRKRGLPYLYLGYYIRESEKMSYKVKYQPMEGLIDDHWQPLSDLTGS